MIRKYGAEIIILGVDYQSSGGHGEEQKAKKFVRTLLRKKFIQEGLKKKKTFRGSPKKFLRGNPRHSPKMQAF